MHWGWDGRNLFMRWFGSELNIPGIATGTPVAVARKLWDVHIFASGVGGSLQHWRFDSGSKATWIGPVTVPVGVPIAFDLCVLSRGPTDFDVFARTQDGGMQQFHYNGHEWSHGLWSLRPATPSPPPKFGPPQPDYLFVRPADHVVLGLNTTGFELGRRPGAGTRRAGRCPACADLPSAAHRRRGQHR